MNIEQLIDDAYDLDIATAKFVLPRLLVFKNWIDGDLSLPPEFINMDDNYEIIYDGKEDWDEVLSTMIYAFSTILNSSYFLRGPDNKVELGLHYFAKYFNYLWV